MTFVLLFPNETLSHKQDYVLFSQFIKQDGVYPGYKQQRENANQCTETEYF